ncbi:MAG: hypothetical protein JKY65_15275 [Planctomycetes bacterium]|nr:hypothetical protein [Planctomycetota bacterium]
MAAPPASELGRYTVVSVIRPPQGRAFVSVGWPGYTGVVSGMNDAGVCAMVLMNFEGGDPPVGTPLSYRVREVLEQASNLDEALEVFRKSPVGSGDFVLLCDPQRAAVVYQVYSTAYDERARPRFEVVRQDSERSLFTLTNGDVDRLAGVQSDDRTCRLENLLATTPRPLSPARLRGLLGAVYLKYINCQAMVFEPGTRTLQLAIGTTLFPAATGDWYQVELAGVLEGGSLDRVAVVPVGTETPEHAHYKDTTNDDERVVARLDRAYRARVAELTKLEDRLVRVLSLSEFNQQVRRGAGISVPKSLASAVQTLVLGAVEATLDSLSADAANERLPRRLRQVAGARLVLLGEVAGDQDFWPEPLRNLLGERARAAGPLVEALGRPPPPLELDATIQTPASRNAVRAQLKEHGFSWALLVNSAPPASPLQSGDLLLEVHGVPTSRWEFLELLRRHPRGHVVAAKLLRKGELIQIQLKVSGAAAGQ